MFLALKKTSLPILKIVGVGAACQAWRCMLRLMPELIELLWLALWYSRLLWLALSCCRLCRLALDCAVRLRLGWPALCCSALLWLALRYSMVLWEGA